MKRINILGIFVLSVIFPAQGQYQSIKPAIIAKAVYFDVSPPLRELALQPNFKFDQTGKDGAVKNFFDILKHPGEKLPLKFVDPVRQYSFGPLTGDTTIVNFDGMSTQGPVPPDTYGEAGPNHYFQVVNLTYQIFNKTGTSLLGPLPNSSMWSGMPNNANSGDPVVVYDEQADRWLFSQLSIPNGSTGPFYQMIAVSQTPDPTSTWYRWEYQFTDLPDYPKFGVWPDGYYMSCNRFTAAYYNWDGIGAVVFDRTAMLAGNSNAQMILFTLSNSSEAYSLLPSDCDGPFPAMGTPNYFTNIYTGSPYHLGIYEFHTDWTTPSNSTFSNFLNLPVATFNASFTAGVPQYGTTTRLDLLNDRLMYRLQYRKFNDHHTMLCNHTVNAGSDVAGVRWYELRKTSGNWFVYQQSTYSPDTVYRWMGSLAMDTSGTIALGYSASSSYIYPSIRYTGRRSGDPLGQMTINERRIINGTGSQTGIWSGRSRWGDYSGMCVDPSEPYTFWYTQEYYTTISNASWRTRIASFQFGPVAPTADFTANTVTPCLYNVVTLSDLSSGNPTSWQWTITPSTFSFADGTTVTSKNPHVTFNKYGNYTIQLMASNSHGSNTKTKTNFISVNTASADFTANPITLIQGNSTVFTDVSGCNPVSWSWNFGSGAAPVTATTQGPHTITYNSTGKKTITLTVNGVSTKTKTDYISVISTDYIMDNVEITTCTGNFYDPGGSGANYFDNQDYTMVFHPGTANSNIRCVFSSFSTEYEANCGYDYLKIYNGSNTSAALLGTWCGTNSPGTITATNATGSLTFVFHSDPAVNSTGWAATISCIPGTSPPVADFTAGNVSPLTNYTVNFTDISVLAPTSWSWSFSPGTISYVNGTGSTSQNPSVQFNNNGIYTVAMTASNGYGSDTKTKTSYIHAGTPGLWTGITSSDWNTISNWHNYILPSGTTNVILSTGAPYWPSLSGDMVMGTSCYNLILQNNSMLTVPGNFTINPGDTLTFTGQGTLKIGGDWNDYGNFNAGTGTIEFNGSSAGKITGGINKAAYIPNYLRSTFAKSMTNLTGATAGPTGDDASMDANIGFTFSYLGVNYTQARINTNGWVSLNQTGPGDAVDNSYLFTVTEPFITLAPWWDDLKADSPTGVVSYKTEGSPPNSVFTVEWNNLMTFYSTITTSRISFQLKLYESSNVIEFCYGSSITGTHDLGESASIGMKDATGGTSHFMEATSGSVINGITGLTSSSNWPTVNYRFTPPSGAETFYNIKENKTNSTVTIQPNIIVNGNVIIN
ncbi:MAG: PKD domain-containing protein [Bacteroidetes bacterium]|nr:PKD domain-containing protein [Bacteroidota bacterium]